MGFPYHFQVRGDLRSIGMIQAGNSGYDKTAFDMAAGIRRRPAAAGLWRDKSNEVGPFSVWGLRLAQQTEREPQASPEGMPLRSRAQNVEKNIFRIGTRRTAIGIGVEWCPELADGSLSRGILV